MTGHQIFLFALLVGVFALLLWGRWRYDLIAFGALLVAVIAGVVPVEGAFAGFAHPATVIIALVLIVSRGLSNSGAIELVTRTVVDRRRPLTVHISLMSALAAILSSVMNNVAALALLMPVELQASAKARRSPAATLMPLSFASILGGLVTLIGTPPNIIIAAFRADVLGEPFTMFDFTPVGAACAVAGVMFVALAGWRLIPGERRAHDTPAELLDLEGYIAEVRVTEGSPAVGKRVSELDPEAEEHEVAITGLVRRGKRLPGLARREEIRKNDVLVIQAAPANLEALAGALRLKYARDAGADSGRLRSEDVGLLEVVVPAGARIEGRSAKSVRLLYRHGVNLLGVSRQGKRFRDRVRELEIEAGDLLLLHGQAEQLADVAAWLGCLPLAARGLRVVKRQQAGACVAIFAVAIGLATAGVLHLPVALGAAAAAMVMLNIVPIREVYESVEWPVIVLLGSMIAIGDALEASGGTRVLAEGLLTLAVGFSPIVVLTLLMVVTMTVSDVLNNTATTIIVAPIAVEIAGHLGASPDSFLMGVAVAASCAFLTPIGHKNNTLIMGPGGYRFGDYWRMGLALEVLVLAVAVPMIVWVWPLQ